MIDPVAQPALAFVIQQMIWGASTNQIVIVSGMGIDEQMITVDASELPAYKLALAQARETTYKTWRGLDVRHLKAQEGQENRQFDVFAALDVATPHLTQATFDFLTLRDGGDYKLDDALVATSFELTAESYLFADEEDVRLCMAFRQQMVQEAEPLRHNICRGAYVLLREPLPRLDQLLIYDYLRLVLTPAGIGVAVVWEGDRWYIPFWWSPDSDINTSQVWVPPRLRFALDVLLAAIWRDACIVQQKTFTERRDVGKGYKAKSKPKHQSDTIRLPRVVYKSSWGPTSDREVIERIARRAHAVRGHYRALEDRTASEMAVEAALEYGYPEPPEGYTFVRPHTRGTGEAMPAVRRVICKGLQVAKTVLG